MPEPNPEAAAIIALCMSAQNLHPKSYATLTDTGAPIDDRRKALDSLIHLLMDEAIAASQEFAAKDELQRRRTLTFHLLALHPPDKDAVGEILLDADRLIPPKPDPETGRPPLTGGQTESLRRLCKITEEKFPWAWRCFFHPGAVLRLPELRETVPEEVMRAVEEAAGPLVGRHADWENDAATDALRKEGFEMLYAYIEPQLKKRVPALSHQSEQQRRRTVVLSLMCFVAKDEWTQDNLEELWSLLVPGHKTAKPGE
ncbi:MAG: hypothetical protein IH851_10615 [Armatimonadetes bacterium]|nr:hypothetical protein [Armatimonadota bacterium]